MNIWITRAEHTRLMVAIAESMRSGEITRRDLEELENCNFILKARHNEQAPPPGPR